MLDPPTHPRDGFVTSSMGCPSQLQQRCNREDAKSVKIIAKKKSKYVLRGFFAVFASLRLQRVGWVGLIP
jgi:hypothetical protein